MRRGGAPAVTGSLARLFSVVSVAPFLLSPAACVRPLRMCVAGADCGALSSCVAGRCVAHGALPAIATSRRMLYDPVAVGYVRRGRRVSDGSEGGGDGRDVDAPAVAALGGGDGALAFLRFSVPLAPEVSVVEAYVLIDRVHAVDADPAPIALHVAPVLDPWDPRSLSWAVQPRVEEMGAPVTRVLLAAGTVVRLDARALVERWRRRRRSDAELGMAIVADGQSATGMAFALAPRAAPHPGSALDGSSDDERVGGPRLELYLH